MRTRAGWRSRIVLGVVLLTAAACGGSAPRAEQSTLAPTMIVERYLSAANQNDLDTMSQLYGTRAGAVADIWTREEIDGHMFLLASILRHSDYAVLGEQIVPGRREEATQYVVRLTIRNEVHEVPFTLVRSVGGRWLIEQICIERITRGLGATC